MMKRAVWLMASISVVWVAVPASAQEPRVEVSVLTGWAFSEGVSGDPIVTGDGSIFNRVESSATTSIRISSI
jgi:hypothetical protein